MEFLGCYCIQLGMHMPSILRSMKCWCLSTCYAFAFLGHIASSYIHMHNDKISYNNDIEFFFIKPLTTWMTGVLILSSTSDIHGNIVESSSWEVFSPSSRIISPPTSTMTYGWLCYKCTFNDVFSLLILCSRLMSEACSSSMVNIVMYLLSFEVTTKDSNLGGRLLRIYLNTLWYYIFSPWYFSWFIKPITLV